MTDHLHRDLQRIKRHVLAMGALAEEALSLASQAYQRQEEVPARRLTETEERINALQLETDDEILKLLALHQPVAGDLRFVTSAMRIVNDLERIGDLTTSISDRLLYIVEQPPLGEPIKIDTMMTVTSTMLHDGLNAFVQQDSALARSVLERDDEIDAMNRSHFDILIPRMKADPESVELAIALLSVSRAVERIGDMATNIAEDVVFMVEAQDIRHAPHDEDVTSESA